MPKCATAAEAVACVKSGHRVFLHGGVATPLVLVQALLDRAPELRDVEITHLHTAGNAEYARPEYAKSFRVANLFTGNNMRPYIDHDRVDYVPCFLSEIPSLFRTQTRHLNVAMVQVSARPTSTASAPWAPPWTWPAPRWTPPTSWWRQINPRMPRVHGDGFVHLDDLDFWIEVDDGDPRAHPPPRSPRSSRRSAATSPS